MNVAEFSQYLTIDQNNLDREIVRQPSLLFQVSEEYAAAMSKRDRLKEILATVDAKLDLAAREELEGEKITEAIIKNKVQIDPAHEEANKKYLTAKHAADVLLALKDAFHQRGYLIRDLAALYNANYFETDSVRDTPDTDVATYKRIKQRLANARANRE